MTGAAQTFAAVVLGALLAALGGFAATQAGIRLDRSRRARDAALLSGEILAAVGTLLRLAEESAGQGLFQDPLALRFLSVARREIDVYDRNRELLFSLENADLRARLHSLVIRLSIPLDRLADGRARYLELCSPTPGSPNLGSADPAPRPGADELREEMEATFRYLMTSRSLIPGLLALLEPLARARFDSYSRIDGDGIPTD